MMKMQAVKKMIIFISSMALVFQGLPVFSRQPVKSIERIPISHHIFEKETNHIATLPPGPDGFFLHRKMERLTQLEELFQSKPPLPERPHLEPQHREQSRANATPFRCKMQQSISLLFRSGEDLVSRDPCDWLFFPTPAQKNVWTLQTPHAG